MQPSVAKVFLSATNNDLAKSGHRGAAKNAIIETGLYPVTMEFFVAEVSAALDVASAIPRIIVPRMCLPRFSSPRMAS